jgi:hypothetical protein
VFNLNPLSVRSLSDGMVFGRKLAVEYTEFYRKYVPGCEDVELLTTAPARQRVAVHAAEQRHGGMGNELGAAVQHRGQAGGERALQRGAMSSARVTTSPWQPKPRAMAA